MQTLLQLSPGWVKPRHFSIYPFFFVLITNIEVYGFAQIPVPEDIQTSLPQKVFWFQPQFQFGFIHSVRNYSLREPLP